MIPVFRPTTAEEEADAVKKVLDSKWIGLGSVTHEFELEFARYLGAQFAVGTNSGTAALHIALMIAGVKSQDEVILPALTFVSCAHAVRYCGGQPVFADVEGEALTIDVADVERKITPRTKAVMAVHFGGHPCALDELTELCKEKGLALIEDCAHASGAEYHSTKVGTFGTGCFSFHAVKNLATGDGGMVVVRDRGMMEEARKYSWLGITKTTWDRYGKADVSSSNWDYLVENIGYKYHMNDITAAIGRVQLSKLDASNRARREVAKYYSEELKDENWITLPVEKKDCKSSFHLYPIRVKERDKLITALAKAGIATSVHYRPLYHHPPYQALRTSLRITDSEWPMLISLPMYPELKEESLEKIVGVIKNFQS